MIEPGGSYGEMAPAPSDAVPVASDAEARRVLSAARAAGHDLPALVLRGGDLHRTLGAARTAVPTLRVPVDLGILETEDRQELFLAHAVLRRRLWAGPFLIAMNAQWCGPLDLGPRSHPGDGRLDLTEGRLGPRQRLLARVRARSGTHLPHPALTTRRVQEHHFDLGRPVTAHLDGESVLTCTSGVVRVIPDAIVVHL